MTLRKPKTHTDAIPPLLDAGPPHVSQRPVENLGLSKMLAHPPPPPSSPSGDHRDLGEQGSRAVLAVRPSGQRVRHADGPARLVGGAASAPERGREQGARTVLAVKLGIPLLYN
ncbi:hypothetical protein JTE90_001810 [Oedothorax gibbosus]|uniref:Uncharacterized protein n=1 Tax=Oedothorax gibbosus TaxID=931172 RepID=A0AAV6VR93_9ARAC|nr:hypothetical protein JTE90_001810 [Oedothorax gibbosus]